MRGEEALRRKQCYPASWMSCSQTKWRLITRHLRCIWGHVSLNALGALGSIGPSRDKGSWDLSKDVFYEERADLRADWLADWTAASDASILCRTSNFLPAADDIIWDAWTKLDLNLYIPTTCIISLACSYFPIWDVHSKYLIYVCVNIHMQDYCLQIFKCDKSFGKISNFWIIYGTILQSQHGMT